jgi:hypothetical protein
MGRGREIERARGREREGGREREKEKYVRDGLMASPPQAVTSTVFGVRGLPTSRLLDRPERSRCSYSRRGLKPTFTARRLAATSAQPPPCAHFRAHEPLIFDISGPVLLTNELGTLWVWGLPTSRSLDRPERSRCSYSRRRNREIGRITSICGR